MSKHLGLIIGVNQYQDSTFRPLQFAENDARALAQWLVNTKGGKWAPPDVQLVQGQLATRELIESLSTQLCINKAEAGDIIVIYFAGHAFIDERNGEGYLALTKTRYQDPASSIHISSFIQQIIATSRAKQILCILDCFQTGQIWSMRRSSRYDSKPLLGQTILNGLQQRQNVLFLCSCRGNEFASEAGERGLGAFAHGMILGLCGPAGDTTTGKITLPRLHAYLFGELAEQQRPQLFGQQQPPVVLVGDIAEPEQIATAPKTGTLGYTAAPPMSGPATSGLTNIPPHYSATATATAQMPPQDQGPFTSGHMLSSALDQQRQQQIQQMMEHAQKLSQAQNYGEAFNTVEKILQVAPHDTSALTLKAQLLGTAGRYPEALATIEQLGQANPNNAIAWSMHAVVLSNMGQHKLALASIERSLELDAQTPESYAIKNNITANIALTESRKGKRSQNQFAVQKQASPYSFFIGVCVQIAGFIIGTAGAALPIVQHRLPIYPALSLTSIGLALLCVNAIRGAYRYGIKRLLITLLISLLAVGTLGGAYKFGYTRILAQLQNNANSWLIVPVLFFVAWLLVAAVVPLLLAIVALISGLVARKGK